MISTPTATLTKSIEWRVDAMLIGSGSADASEVERQVNQKIDEHDQIPTIPRFSAVLSTAVPKEWNLLAQLKGKNDQLMDKIFCISGASLRASEARITRLSQSVEIIIQTGCLKKYHKSDTNCYIFRQSCDSNAMLLQVVLLYFAASLIVLWSLN